MSMVGPPAFSKSTPRFELLAPRDTFRYQGWNFKTVGTKRRTLRTTAWTSLVHFQFCGPETEYPPLLYKTGMPDGLVALASPETTFAVSEYINQGLK